MHFLLQNKMHINDWQSIQTLWDKLNKQLEKTQKVTGALGTPRPYVKILVELEDFLNKTLAGKMRDVAFLLFVDDFIS
jgi:translation initiation factor 3 subunit C